MQTQGTSIPNVIPFPKRSPPHEIDWRAIEEERLRVYPKISKKALEILRKILDQGAATPKGTIMVTDTDEGYPPDPFPVSPCTTGVIWILDLLDRFGGELSYGSLCCKIRRKKKRLPVFLIEEISETTYKALCAALGGEFEHFVQSKHWQLIGKELTEVDLMIVLISCREEGGKNYVGLFDRRTIMILFRNLGNGVSVENLLKWSL